MHVLIYVLVLGSPEDGDGGSPVNLYEVGCTTPDNQTQEAYRGKDTSCFVNGLLPGRSYLFQIRAYNRMVRKQYQITVHVM